MAEKLPHRRVQAAEAASFGAEAEAIGRSVLSAEVIIAATTLVTKVMIDAGGGPVGEAASDMRTLRNDPRFNGTLERDIRLSVNALALLMVRSLQYGFESEARFQSTQIKGITFTVTDQDRRDMYDYPIQGHTCGEISVYMHNAFRYEITGLLSSPLVGDSNTDSLPAFIADAIKRFTDRCSSAAEEAYYAGTQMAIRGVAAALKGK